MEVTEVRIKLMDEPGDRLKAFCSVTFDNCFVVRDLKIIEGATGPFVAMPSRKLTAHCRKCGCKNHLRATYCNQCGERQAEGRGAKDADGRAKLYADIAHPINSGCREMIQERVIEEFLAEQQLAQQPNYVSRYDDYDLGFEESRQDKPIRVDPSHIGPSQVGAPASQPHVASDSLLADSESQHHPHFSKESNPNRSASQENDSPRSDGFGAGILPGG